MSLKRMSKLAGGGYSLSLSIFVISSQLTQLKLFVISSSMMMCVCVHAYMYDVCGCACHIVLWRLEDNFGVGSLFLLLSGF